MLINSKNPPGYLLVACTFVGAFIGLLLPGARSVAPVRYPGVLNAFISFQLNHESLIEIVGAVVLLYWLFAKKVNGPAAMIICGALGLILVKLTLASLLFLH